jgi:hypothetical protein
MYNPSPEKLAVFTKFYIENGFNALQACLAMGMRPSTAKGASAVFRKRATLTLAQRLRARGLDEDSQAKKLAELREAQMPKWNAGTEDWDIFDDGHLQMEAVKEINRILDAYPAEEKLHIGDNVTVIFNANVEPERKRERTLTIESHQADAT